METCSSCYIFGNTDPYLVCYVRISALDSTGSVFMSCWPILVFSVLSGVWNRSLTKRNVLPCVIVFKNIKVSIKDN